MKRIIFLLCALITCVTNISASEPIVRIAEPLSFFVTSDYKVLNAKDNSNYFILQCPGYTAAQLKEKFIKALSDLDHMSDYFGQKFHRTNVYANDVSMLKFSFYEMPFYSVSCKNSNAHPTRVPHLFWLRGEIKIEFRDGRIKIYTPEDADVGCDGQGLYNWQSYFNCTDTYPHYGTQKTSEIRYYDVIKAFSEAYMELIYAVNNPEKLLEYKNSTPQSVSHISKEKYMLFSITPDGEVVINGNSGGYVDLALKNAPGLYIRYIKGTGYKVETINEEDGEYKLSYVGENNDVGTYKICWEWVYVFKEGLVRVYPPKMRYEHSKYVDYQINIETFRYGLKDYLEGHDLVDKSGFKSSKNAVERISRINELINNCAFRMFLNADEAYDKAVKENQW